MHFIKNAIIKEIPMKLQIIDIFLIFIERLSIEPTIPKRDFFYVETWINDMRQFEVASRLDVTPAKVLT